MKTCTIYHNPRCSKSRETLALIEEAGLPATVRDYLNTAPTTEELKQLLQQLGLPAQAILRQDEPEWKATGLKAADQDESTVIAAIAVCPRLLQRPIVVVGDKAAIGRPPENILPLIS